MSVESSVDSRYLAIRQNLVRWFSAEGKDYPWRRTHDAWAVAVSEVMLQQTTINTVVGRYEQWMAQFPTPRSLAEATEQEALRSWEGLGYYRRVRSLQKMAQVVLDEYDGVFPSDLALLKKLPGIGDYTAGAICSFAFNIPAPIVDANVSRVFARLENDPSPIDAPETRRRHWQLAEQLVDPENARIFNSAIMELGQLFCLPRSPKCSNCPLKQECLATEPDSLPNKLPSVELRHEIHHDIICLRGEALLLAQSQKGRHEGMYRLPQRSAEECAKMPVLFTQKYSVTHHRITRTLYRAPEDIALREGEAFVSLQSLDELPLASPDRKAWEKFFKSKGFLFGI